MCCPKETKNIATSLMYKKKTLLYRDTTAAVPAAGTMLVGKYTEDVARFFCRLLDQRTLRHQAKNLPPPRARTALS